MRTVHILALFDCTSYTRVVSCAASLGLAAFMARGLDMSHLPSRCPICPENGRRVAGQIAIYLPTCMLTFSPCRGLGEIGSTSYEKHEKNQADRTKHPPTEAWPRCTP